MSEDHRRFGQCIRAARDGAHMKRNKLAELAEIEPNYLGQIERGERWPSLEVIVRIANAIGVPPSVFLELSPVPSEPEALRLAISELLANRDAAELQTVFRLIRAVVAG